MHKCENSSLQKCQNLTHRAVEKWEFYLKFSKENIAHSFRVPRLFWCFILSFEVNVLNVISLCTHASDGFLWYVQYFAYWCLDSLLIVYKVLENIEETNCRLWTSYSFFPQMLYNMTHFSSTVQSQKTKMWSWKKRKWFLPSSSNQFDL